MTTSLDLSLLQVLISHIILSTRPLHVHNGALIAHLGSYKYQTSNSLHPEPVFSTVVYAGF